MLPPGFPITPQMRMVLDAIVVSYALQMVAGSALIFIVACLRQFGLI
jgi:hypothetical protein